MTGESIPLRVQIGTNLQGQPATQLHDVHARLEDGRVISIAMVSEDEIGVFVLDKDKTECVWSSPLAESESEPAPE